MVVVVHRSMKLGRAKRTRRVAVNPIAIHKKSREKAQPMAIRKALEWWMRAGNRVSVKPVTMPKLKFMEGPDA